MDTALMTDSGGRRRATLFNRQKRVFALINELTTSAHSQRVKVLLLQKTGAFCSYFIVQFSVNSNVKEANLEKATEFRSRLTLSSLYF